MTGSPRSLAQQVRIVVVVVLTAIASGAVIGWLLSARVPAQVSQAPQATEAATTAAPALPAATIPPAQPTIVPTPSPAVSIAVPPSSTAAPASPIAQQPATALLQQVAVAEEALRSGEFEAVLDYGQGTQSTAQMRFDIGTADSPARLEIRTAYHGSGSAQALDMITIGDHSWERRDNQAWSAVPFRKGMWDQIQMFLPRAASGSNPSLTQHADQLELRWYDPANDADITLTVDPETRLPRSLQREARRTGLILSVTYQGWNTPVEILSPVENTR